MEKTVSGSCGLFSDLASLNFRIFNENSHFGMVAPGVFFCFFLSIKKNEFLKLNNIIFYFIIFFLYMSIFSMTLLLGLILSFIALLFSINKKNYIYFIMPFILVCLSLAVIYMKESCSSRVERINLLDSINYLNSSKNYNIEIRWLC